MATIDKNSYAHMFGPDCISGDRVHEVDTGLCSKVETVCVYLSVEIQGNHNHGND